MRGSNSAGIQGKRPLRPHIPTGSTSRSCAAADPLSSRRPTVSTATSSPRSLPFQSQSRRPASRDRRRHPADCFRPVAAADPSCPGAPRRCSGSDPAAPS